MTIYEQLCITKLFYLSIGMIEPATVSKAELEIACEALKHLADQRYDWTGQQKAFYKFLVDYKKNITDLAD